MKIGKNVKNIDPMFAYNKEIDVEIDSENPYYMTENHILYTKNKEKLVTANYKINGKFTFDSNVKEIENYAFYNQSGMTEIDLGENLEKIGGQVFYACNALRSIIIPKSVKTISTTAFDNAQNLKEIIINNKENAVEGAPWGCPAGAKAIIWNEK